MKIIDVMCRCSCRHFGREHGQHGYKIRFCRDNSETVIGWNEQVPGERDTWRMTKQVSLLTSVCLLLLCSVAASAQSDATASLKSAKSIYVKSSSLLVGTSVIEEKLQKRAEFSQMGLVITRNEGDADIILEVHHDRFTKYVYTAIDSKRNIVVASGKLSSLGGTVAGKVAKRFMKQVMQARATGP